MNDSKRFDGAASRIAALERREPRTGIRLAKSAARVLPEGPVVSPGDIVNFTHRDMLIHGRVKAVNKSFAHVVTPDAGEHIVKRRALSLGLHPDAVRKSFDHEGELVKSVQYSADDLLPGQFVTWVNSHNDQPEAGQVLSLGQFVTVQRVKNGQKIMIGYDMIQSASWSRP